MILFKSRICFYLYFAIPLMVFQAGNTNANAADNLIIVVIDGARYTETFGDPLRRFIPEMDEIAAEGSYLGHFYNDSITYTSRAVPALWCGTWTEINQVTVGGNLTNSAEKPTLFEYFRKQKNRTADKCFYVLKYLQNLWLPSYDPEYGPDYWPAFHSVGATDAEVASQAQMVMDASQPELLWIYLADVDHEGHSGEWENYTAAIKKADSIVAVIWNKVQTDPHYQNNTNLLVTNDHGRHDDLHGGFQHHGDDCAGCRHIMLLAVGPDIKQNYSSFSYRHIPDFAVTAAALLNVNPEKATGEVISEILTVSGLEAVREQPLRIDFELEQNYPNPFNSSTTIEFFLNNPAEVKIEITSISGEIITVLKSGKMSSGIHSILWDAAPFSSGIYLIRLTAGGRSEIRKAILMK